MFLDCHTHFIPSKSGIRAIINTAYQQEAIDTSDFERSVGLHPWHLEAGAEWLSGAREWLIGGLQSEQVIAIGECGLDKVTQTPWDTQMAAFQVCIEIAFLHKKPLILHCVRAYDDMIAIKKASEKRYSERIPWIIHGFDKHPNTAQSLTQAGFYLSFGAAILDDSKHAAAALKAVPSDRFFLETDVAETISIETIYECTATIRQCSIEQLIDNQNLAWKIFENPPRMSGSI